MADRRAASIFFNTSPTLPVTGACLLYGVVLSARAGGASLSIYDVNSKTAAPLASRKVVVYTSSATGTKNWNPPLPVEMTNGIFCSMSARGNATIIYSTRQ